MTALLTTESDVAPVLSLDERAARAALVKGTERRRLTASGIELRGGKGSAVDFRGYASTFDETYDMGWYSEVVRSGAFTKTLSEAPDVQLLINHDGLPLARTTSGTLTLSEDDHGLLSSASLDTRDDRVRNLLVAVERGDVTEMSFAFWTVRQQWSPDYDQRDLIELSLDRGDVSIVSFGANPGTSVDHMRSAIGRMTIEDLDAARHLLDERRAALAPVEDEPPAPVDLRPLLRARVEAHKRSRRTH